MQMPGMDGEMLGSQIKSDPQLQATKLIMMTSLNHWGGARNALQVGFSAYLVKPIKQSRLLDCILNILVKPSGEMGHKVLGCPPSSIFHTHAQTTDFETDMGLPIGTPSYSAPPKKMSKLKILMVEDNVVNQKVTLNQLKALGYAADIAANGQEALKMLGHITYDLILMDCQMPVLDGYSATQEIRSMEGDMRRTVIVALTANALREDRVRCINAGMDDYLSKPILKDKLATKLNYWSRVLLSHREETSPATKANWQVNTYAIAPIAPTPKALPPLPIDWNHLHQISDHNPEFELELLQMFAEDTEQHLNQLEAAIATQDFPAVEQQAHHIKGSSANVGLRPMQTAASKLEIQARNHQLDNPIQQILILQQTLEALKIFLALNLIYN
jgi:CheY-like chemotaxis protein